MKYTTKAPRVFTNQVQSYHQETFGESDDSFSLDVASNSNRCLAKTFGKNAPILDKDWLRRCLALVF